MIESPLSVQLRCTNGDSEIASYVVLTPPVANKGVMEDWWNWSGVSQERLQAERDLKWPWPAISAKSLEHDFFEARALMTRDQRVQGCIQYALSNFQDANEAYKDCDSELDPGASVVYVELLATAPWNRLSLMGDKREFSGVGKALLVLAICASYNVGYRGRLKLDAYPEVTEVYRGFGFEYIRELAESTVLMELPSMTALQKLRERELL